MGLLSTGNKVASLQKESDGCFNVFKSTVDNLATINGKIVSEIETRDAQIDTLAREKTALQSTQEGNAKLIKKIQDFLN